MKMELVMCIEVEVVVSGECRRVAADEVLVRVVGRDVPKT